VIADDLSGLGAVFALAGERVERVATTNGTLVLEFSDGSTIRCDPDPEYEAWQVVGGDPFGLVICTGGGELAIWDRREPPLSSEEARKLFRDLGLGPLPPESPAND